MRLVTLGVGAQASPLYAPAGLLVCRGGQRVMLDGGPGAEPRGRIDAWRVCDDRSELRTQLHQLARARGLAATVSAFEDGGLALTPRLVTHTSHPTYGYLIEAAGDEGRLGAGILLLSTMGEGG